MKIIKCLSHLIEEELEDAKKYIDLAAKWKQDEPQVANLFHELSTEEMGHVDKLHKAVTEKIAEYRAKNGDPPKEMMVLYDYLHEKHIAEATKIKVMQNLFRGE
jgi:rubrerythrin